MNYEAWIPSILFVVSTGLLIYIVRRYSIFSRLVENYEAVLNLYIQLYEFQYQVQVNNWCEQENMVENLQRTLLNVSHQLPKEVSSSLSQVLDEYDEALLMEGLEKEGLYSYTKVDASQSDVGKCMQGIHHVLEELRKHISMLEQARFVSAIQLPSLSSLGVLGGNK